MSAISDETYGIIKQAIYEGKSLREISAMTGIYKEKIALIRRDITRPKSFHVASVREFRCPNCGTSNHLKLFPGDCWCLECSLEVMREMKKLQSS